MELWDKLTQYHNGNLSHSEQVAVFFDLFPQKRSALENILSVEDRFSKSKVKAALDEKYQELQLSQSQQKFTKTSVPDTSGKGVDISLLPDDLRKEHRKLSPIYVEISHEHARLFYCNTNEQRFSVAKHIIELTRQRRSIWNMIDEFKSSGNYTKPEPTVRTIAKTVVNELSVEDYKRLQQLRVQRSKLKGKPNRVEDYNRIVKDIKDLEAKRS